MSSVRMFFLAFLLISVGACAWGTLPDMAGVVAPSPEPAYPASFDPFVPPVDSSTPAAGCPTFAEWTRSGAADDTIAATGDQLSSYTGNDQGKDTRFLVYGQTTDANGTLKSAKIQRLDGMKTAFTLDSGVPGWSMYLVWPRNSNGYGRPAAINRTEAWWLGPKKAEPGQTIAILGRNLSHNNGTTTSYVYIKKDSTTVIPVTVTSVNPYRVAFTVPSDLTNGNYEVWAHNGHGGRYGWSGPLTLTVYHRLQWTGPVKNVMDYGATGDGSTDDQLAIYNAMNAAGAVAGSTVYFPAGTYMISRGFTPPNNCRILGAGKDSTFIKLNSGFVQPPSWDGRCYGLLFADTSFGRSTLDVQDITLDANNNLNGYISTLIWLRASSDVRFTNVRIKAIGYSPCDFNGSNGLYMTNCEIDGKDTFLGGSTQVFIDHVDHYGTNDTQAAWTQWGTSEISVTNSTARDYDNSQTWGWNAGRFYAGNGNWGCSRCTYLGDNQTYDLTVRNATGVDQNVGEQILYENGITYYRGSPSAATATTATFSGLSSDYTGSEAVIVSGKGIGQHRKITSCVSGTMTVTPAWNVIPDSTSSILAETVMERTAIYHNTLDAKDYAATQSAHIASAGIEAYGGCDDWVADNNTFNQVRTAIADWTIGQTSPINDIQPCFSHLYVNNVLQGNRWAGGPVLGFYSNAAVDPGLSHLSHIYRHNAVTSPVIQAFTATAGSWTSTGRQLDLAIFEHNTGTNIPIGIDTSGLASKGISILAYKNNLDRGSAALSGSKGYYFGSGTNPGLREDSLTNFQSQYSGSTPGAVLEAPERCFEMTAIQGSASQSASLTIWNAGTSSLSWTASKDASWLSLSSTSGSVSNEGNSSMVTLTCNPSGLAVGTYTGTVTVTGSSQTKKATVILTVVSPTSIYAIKQSPDGTSVSLGAEIVSAVFGSYYYAESADRACGIRVYRNSSGLSVGMKVDVSGVLATNPDGERYINASTSTRNGAGLFDILPLFITDSGLGGGDYYYNSSTGAGQMGLLSASGLNNVGLLMRICGYVTYSDPAGGFVYLDDSSGVSDSNPYGAPGVRVIIPLGVVWPSGSYFGVTGVSSLTTVSGSRVRALRIRSAADVSVVM